MGTQIRLALLLLTLMCFVSSQKADSTVSISPASFETIRAIAVSADGSLVAILGYGETDSTWGVMELWSTADSSLVAVLSADTEEVRFRTPMFNDSGRLLLVDAGEETLIWDTQSTELVAEVEGFAAFVPARDDIVVVFPADEGPATIALLPSLQAAGSIDIWGGGLVANSSGSVLVSSNFDNVSTIHEQQTGRWIEQDVSAQVSRSLQLTPIFDFVREDLLAFVLRNPLLGGYELRLFELSDDGSTLTQIASTYMTNGVSFVMNANAVAIIDRNNQSMIVDPITQATIATPDPGGWPEAFADSDQHYGWTDGTGTLRVFSLPEREQVAEVPECFCRAIVSRDGTRLVYWTDEVLHVVDLK